MVGKHRHHIEQLVQQHSPFLVGGGLPDPVEVELIEDSECPLECAGDLGLACR
jgi:hypothetical protein